MKEVGSVRDVGQHISAFYGKYFYMGTRRWKLLGLRYADAKRSQIDAQHVADVFFACSGDPMPSRTATFYLLNSQVRTIRKVMGSMNFSSSIFSGIHTQEIYDYMTLKALSLHRDCVDKSGNLKPSFTRNPVTFLDNAHTRIIKDAMYDMYRYELEKKKGRTAWNRPLSSRVRFANASVHCSHTAIYEIKESANPNKMLEIYGFSAD